MNLFFKSYRFYFIFFLFITCESGFNRGLTKGKSIYLTPWIQEIRLPSQYADIPNKSLFLDDFGHIFLGKENGLTIIHGKSSVHLHLDGPVYVTGTDPDTLFYACENDMGYLARSDDKSFHTISLKHLFSRGLRNFVPFQLIQFEYSYFINSDRGIYYLGKEEQQHFPYPVSETRLHKVDGELYLTVEDRGILRWTEGAFEEMITLQQTGDAPARLLTGGEDGLQILNEKGELYILGTDDADPLMVASFPVMEGITFTDHINDQLLLVTTRDQGIGVYDNQGRSITLFENKGGLPEQDIQQICCCHNSEIWVLAPHSLHKITYPSPLDILEINVAETGSILASVVLENGFVLGTSRGVHIAEYDTGNRNRLHLHNLTPDTRESIHLLATDGHLLFAAGSRNLYSIAGGNAEILDQGSYTGLLLVDDRAVVASNEEGVISYHLLEDGWNIRQIDPELSSSHSFVLFNDEVFFLSSNGVYKLSDDLKSTFPVPFHRDDLLYRLIEIERVLYLVGSDHVYVYDKDEGIFNPRAEDLIAEILSTSDVIFPVESGQYWIVQNDSKYRSRVINISDLEKFPEGQRVFPVLQNLGEIITLTVRDSVVYITGKDKVALFNLRGLEDHQGDANIRIERISSEDTGDLDLGFLSSGEQFPDREQMVLSYQSNDIEIHLAGMDYQSVPEPLFRYRLHPDQKTWGSWNSNRKIILRDLKQGKYRFMAQSKDLFGRISDPVELSFIIKPPFYRTGYAYVIYVLLLLIGLFLFRKWRLLSYQRAESRISLGMQNKLDDLALEKEKSDKLMADLLPEKTAEQLKSRGRSKWDKYERATVLFSDIQGFTRIAEEMNPELLIDELDKFFFHFDSVVDKYNIEKIKTIGDAYMAAGGIPEKNSTNPVEVVLAALEMQAYMQQLKSTRAEIWDLRIGIHTGPVIAGVIGHKKVSYDIWGDTVNTASRMESSGIPGKVNISGITYEMVKDYFMCEYRGKLPVKYKGNIDMYFVTGLRPELSVDLKGIPNKRFFVKLQLLRLGDLEEKVFSEILKKLPETLHFHRPGHARKVYDQSFLLCRSEEIEQEERLLVRTAALMLFTGLAQSYTNYENRSSVITREVLPDFKYSESQIDQICNLILSTKMPFDPHNQLEKILIDAKMEYIGRPDYPARIKLFYQELKVSGRKITWQQFKQEQLEFLSHFSFFTLAGQRLREIPAEEQMASLKHLDG